MVIWWVNLVANAIVLAICVWAVLNQRVDTRVIGTISLSSLGLFAALNLLRLGQFGGQAEKPEAMMNVSLACLLVWMCRRYRCHLNACSAKR